jgi:O-succinylbenzoate synthase
VTPVRARPIEALDPVRLDAVELIRVAMPLVAPFRSAHGTAVVREAVVVRAVTTAAEGWGECSAERSPAYSSEFTAAAELVLADHLLPRLAGTMLTCTDVARLLSGVNGHHMAKSAIEAAVLDAQLRSRGMSLCEALGATREHVEVGVAVGLQPDLDALLSVVGRHVEEGYRRVKLKIEPGRDVDVVRAVRAEHPDLMLFADANGSYGPADVEHLCRLDDLGLALIEQPFAADDLITHAALAVRMTTPVCLDESVVSPASFDTALALGAIGALNLKPARVGGYLAALALHDRCLEAGLPLWCGGLLETGIGRAANLALAALPGFTLPGDISATNRYWARDITPSMELRDGGLDVPHGPGIGVDVDLAALAQVTTARRTIAMPPTR